jgi:hypothetical protein
MRPLYSAVTTYVRDEMNRAERFAEANEQRRVNVGFALQIPATPRRLIAGHESLRRRRERLDRRLAEVRLVARGAAFGAS